MSLQERLKLVIKDSDLSIPDFAKKMGVAGSTIVNYRDGRTSPNFDLLMDICEKFPINPAWLLLGEGPMRRRPAAPPGEITPGPEVGSQLLEHIPESYSSRRPEPLENYLMFSVLKAMEEFLTNKRLKPPLEKWTRLLTLVYNHCAQEFDRPDPLLVEKYYRLI